MLCHRQTKFVKHLCLTHPCNGQEFNENLIIFPALDWTLCVTEFKTQNIPTSQTIGAVQLDVVMKSWALFVVSGYNISQYWAPSVSSVLWLHAACSIHGSLCQSC